jgi:cardiolipin synthase
MQETATAHQVQILDGGAELYPRMLAAIASARETIHLEVYAFALDATGERFADALADAARRGVRVTVVVDGVGSALDGRLLEMRLESAGTQFRIYHPLSWVFLGYFRRNHRKILLCDDEVAFLGGINLGDENSPWPLREAAGPWADLAAEVRGPACAWLGARLRRGRLPVLPGPVRIWLSGLGGGGPLRRRYVKAIGSARRTVGIAHGYFLPDRRLVRTITAAARRGVAVTMLLPGKSDVPFARQAARRLHRPLLRAGVRLYEWDQTVLHAKAAVVDGERMLLGSFNLDPLSLANLETLLEVRGGAAPGAVEAWIARHCAGARAVAPEEVEGRSWLQRWVLERFGLWAARSAWLVGRLLRR